MDQHTGINHLIDHFFRHEAGKMVSVLTKIFGAENMDLAEDVVQDSLVEAISNWQYNGIPQNPSAWLYRVAKNRALNIIHREKYRKQYAAESMHFPNAEWTAEPTLDYLFSEQQIQDDQLRMIFTCCHPAISIDGQIALALKTLCGLSIPEIAKAFLTSEENINKRLVRARQKIRDLKIPLDLPGGRDLEERLQSVLETIYLLFNEGYSASRGNDIIRYELCEEAIRLNDMILGNPSVKEKSCAYALQALMQLNASRFKARQDAVGNILTLEKQDRSRWDHSLLNAGFISLEKATASGEISRYHILAAISAYYCAATKYELTDWKSILALYDRLLEIEHSPLVLLNRAVAVSKVAGVARAIEELKKIEDSVPLRSYHHFYSTLGTFYMEAEEYKMAIPVLEKAVSLAPLDAEKAMLQKKMEYCLNKVPGSRTKAL
jgi:RNA polymerase sigma factor (sigma-70 family)